MLEKEENEVKVLSKYMPEQLSSEEVEKVVIKAIEISSATSMKDMGKVMGLVKNEISGRANMGDVSKIIKSKLS